MLDWEKFKPKRILELEKENAALYDKIFRLEDENKDLKNQLSSSDLIVAEYEGRVLALKAKIKELILKTTLKLITVRPLSTMLVEQDAKAELTKKHLN